MMGFIKAVVIFALVLFVFATMCAVISAWRQGVLGRDIDAIKSGLGGVYLRFKKFAQQKFFNRTTWVHIRSYWMYYGLALIIISISFTD